jgi:hypothetical protein
MKDYEEDGGFLRFAMVDATLRFLIIAYNITRLIADGQGETITEERA